MRAWLLVVLAACASGGKNTKDESPVHSYNALAVAMCSCEDEACGEPLVTREVELRKQPTEAKDAPPIGTAKRVFDRCAADLGVGASANGAAVADMGRFAKDICACKDMDCVQKVQSAFADKYKDRKGDVRLTEREAKAVAEAADKMTPCIEKIAGSEEPVRHRGSVQNFVDDYKMLADAVCACKDTNCLMEAMQTAQDLGTRAGELAADLTAEQGQTVAEASQKMSDCAAKVTGAYGYDDGEAVLLYQDLADEVCKCKDAACVTEVQERASELASRFSDFSPTAEEAQAIAKAGEKFGKCASSVGDKKPNKKKKKKKGKKGH